MSDDSRSCDDNRGHRDHIRRGLGLYETHKIMKVRKPYNPAAKAEALAEIARLKAQGAEVNVDQRTGKLLSAKRSHVFNILLAANQISQNDHQAVMRFSDLWAAWKRCDGGSDSLDRVDEHFADRHSLMRRQLAARAEVEQIMAKLGPLDRQLLSAFMRDYVELAAITVWRVTVQNITGIKGRDAQTAPVILMCKNLRMVMEAPRKRAA